MKKELDEDLLSLRIECLDNPNVHPYCIGIVDMAIAEIKRLEQIVSEIKELAEKPSGIRDREHLAGYEHAQHDVLMKLI